MNANKISTKGSQMKRIQNVSIIFRAISLCVFILCIVGAFSLVISSFIVGSFAVLKNESITSAGAEIFMGIWAWFCYRLFNLCAHGDLFTSKIVFYIRRVGYTYFLMMLASFVSRLFLVHQVTANLPATKTNSEWQLNGLISLLISFVPGLLILFIAWIMDEGRKIQEEQELTV
jgi:hypothetical protein